MGSHGQRQGRQPGRRRRTWIRAHSGFLHSAAADRTHELPARQGHGANFKRNHPWRLATGRAGAISFIPATGDAAGTSAEQGGTGA